MNIFKTNKAKHCKYHNKIGCVNANTKVCHPKNCSERINFNNGCGSYWRSIRDNVISLEKIFILDDELGVEHNQSYLRYHKELLSKLK